jgi:hypothetical protein
MITNTGKSILGKYLIGQAPAYASYIAVGCGAKPLASTDAFADYSSKETLDFEMFRVPITSSGYISDGSTTKIAFTAELPTTERYDITEIALYPSSTNPIAQGSDSRMLYTFTEVENWEYHNATGTTIVTAPGTTISTNSVIDPVALPKSFILSSNDLLFANEDRLDTYEKPRFLENTILLNGSTSSIVPNSVTGEFEVQEDDTDGHIHATGQNVNFDKNTANDELKLSFSIIPTESTNVLPDNVYIVIQFTSSESTSVASEYAKMQIMVTSEDFADGNYFVKTVKLGGGKTTVDGNDYYIDSLYKTSQFSWAQVSTVKVYACAIRDDANSATSPDVIDEFYIALDGLRFENKTSLIANPLYGLVAYSPVKNDIVGVTPATGGPIEKSINSNNMIEFRFGFDVGGA